MSADNAIAILKTHDLFWQVSDIGRTNMQIPQPVWRVAHIQNPESFDYYRTQEIHNLGWWMAETFGKAKTFLNEADALAYAQEMEQSYSFVEYGIMTFDAKNRNFPGF